MSKYLIEVTRSNAIKSTYKRYFGGDNQTQVFLIWQSLNIGNGYKARLKENGKIIARKVS